MLLSTQTEGLQRLFGMEEAVRIICETGFDAIDLSMFMGSDDKRFLEDGYKDLALQLKEIAAGYGVVFNQAHAPFASQKEGDEAFNAMQFDRIVRSMECAALVGAESIIVHPIHTQSGETDWEWNLEFYNRLLPYAKQFGIKIALENIWDRNPITDRIKPLEVCGTAEGMAAFYDELDPEWFVCCLDVGHCAIVGSDPPHYVRTLGHDRLKALHVHDNDLYGDQHQLPFLGKNDWESFTKILAEINYDGVFTFEADDTYRKFPKELAPSLCRFMHAVGRYLIGQIENA
ncbi:MAG: sugar phosphate isomerase/epimerase [Oscillospiraceae bacterium]|jgi:sugar phosphate isomerase/epimerase|nr:sugar phosphate isomerase/epimerase [Oscillospiraceae bacterium]